MPRYQQSDQTPQDNSLEDLLRLAQIAHLTGQTESDQQQVDQQDQRARMTAAIQLLGLKQEADQHAAALAETVHSRDATTKGNLMESLVSHLAQRGDVPLSTIADTLDQAGNPELATSLRHAHVAEVQAKATKLLPAIVAARAKGGDTYKTLTSAIDPDVLAAIQPHLPPEVASPVDTSSLGTKLGQLSRMSYMANPMVLPFVQAKAAVDATAKVGFHDFWNALINKQPQPAQ